MLPDIDGYEVLRRLRAARVRTPILILSGLGRARSQDQGPGLRRRRFPDQAVRPARADRPHPGDRAPLEGPFRIDDPHRQAGGQSRQPHRRGRRPAAAPDRQGIRHPRAVEPAQGHDADQGDVPQPSLWRHGRARAQDHRRVRLQAAQEARPRRPAATTTSRPCGAAAMCCAIRSRRRLRRPSCAAPEASALRARRAARRNPPGRSATIEPAAERLGEQSGEISRRPCASVSSAIGTARASAARISGEGPGPSPVASISGPIARPPTTSRPPRGRPSPADASIAQASFCHSSDSAARLGRYSHSIAVPCEEFRRQQMRRRPGQPAAAETIGKAIELQPPAGLAALSPTSATASRTNSGSSSASSSTPLPIAETGPIRSWHSRAAQQFDHPQVDGSGHGDMLP